MKRSMRCLLLLPLLLLLAPVSAQRYDGPRADIDQILANALSFSAHVMAGDLDGILGAYTPDAKIFPHNRPILEGADALADYWRPQPGYRTIAHELTPVEIKVTGDEARDYGTFTGVTLDPDGQEHPWQGKYVVVWKKMDGDWKMYLDIWNASPPPADRPASGGLPAGFRVLARPGLWVAEGPQLGQADGLTIKSFRAGLGGRTVHVQTGTTDPETGRFAPRNEGLRYWAATDSSWHFQEYDRDGGVTSGQVSFSDRNVYYDYDYQGTRLRDAWIYVDDDHYRYVVGSWDGEAWVRKFHEGVFVFRPSGGQ